MGTVITENIKDEILSWTGVTSNPYQFGGVEFMSIKEKWVTYMVKSLDENLLC
jgi:hypothetical protein